MECNLIIHESVPSPPSNLACPLSNLNVNLSEETSPVCVRAEQGTVVELSSGVSSVTSVSQFGWNLNPPPFGQIEEFYNHLELCLWSF